MNEYRLRESGKVISEQELRSMFPNVFLPKILSAVELEQVKADPVLKTPEPYETGKVAVRNGIQADMAGNWVTSWMLVEREPDAPEVLAARAAHLSEQIDDTVAAAYARPQRFVKEYEEREAQARAYINEVNSRPNDAELPPAPPRIEGFARAAGISAPEAGRLTIASADKLRTALAQLSDLRMRKYEVQRATSLVEMEMIFAAIMAEIGAVASTIE